MSWTLFIYYLKFEKASYKKSIIENTSVLVVFDSSKNYPYYDPHTKPYLRLLLSIYNFVQVSTINK